MIFKHASTAKQINLSSRDAQNKGHPQLRIIDTCRTFENDTLKPKFNVNFKTE